MARTPNVIPPPFAPIASTENIMRHSTLKNKINISHELDFKATVKYWIKYCRETYVIFECFEKYHKVMVNTDDLPDIGSS